MCGQVICKTCGKGYRSIFQETEQGDGCASDVSGSFIHGNYGSAVIDMETWEFVGDRPDGVKDGVICDPCVTRLKDSGQIAMKSSGVW